MNAPNPRLLSRRVARTFSVATLAAILGTSSLVAHADPLTFNLINPDGNQSRINLSAAGTLLGGALTVTPQVAPAGLSQGSLSTLYTGSINTQLTQQSLGLPGGGSVVAQTSRTNTNSQYAIAPGLNGAAGTAPANYGVRLVAPLDFPIPPIELEGQTLNLGTLSGVQMDLALRDVTLGVTAAGNLPLTPGSLLPQSFDASQVDLAIAGNADIRLAAQLKQTDVLSYFLNLGILTVLAGQQPDLGLTVSGNLGTQTISIGAALRQEIPLTSVDNSAAGAGTLEHVGPNYRMTIPVNFQLVPDLGDIGNLFDATFGLTGQLVAETPFQEVAVPEPSSVILALTAFSSLGLVAYRRRRKA